MPVLGGAIRDCSQSSKEMPWRLFGLLVVTTILSALLIEPWTESQKGPLALCARPWICLLPTGRD